MNNIHKNCMGTVSFSAKFGKMRKEEEFIVYPIDSKTERIVIQSERRFATLKIDGGILIMSSGKIGANSITLQLDVMKGKAEKVIVSPEDMEVLLSAIRKTSSNMAGENGIVYCNNAEAKNI